MLLNTAPGFAIQENINAIPNADLWQYLWQFLTNSAIESTNEPTNNHKSDTDCHTEYDSDFMKKPFLERKPGYSISSSNNAKFIEDSTGTTWIVKPANEAKDYTSGIVELFGSAIYTHFLGSKLAPFNIIVKDKDGKNYIASRKIENSISLGNMRVASSEIHNLYEAAALALFTGLGSNGETKNILVVKDNDSVMLTEVDFQNNNRLVDYIYNESGGHDRAQLCDFFPFIESYSDNVYIYGFAGVNGEPFRKNELKLPLIRLANTPDFVFRKIIYDKFIEFEWYFKENNLDVNAEVGKYMFFINATKDCIKTIYQE
jgi:hypothetical protein